MSSDAGVERIQDDRPAFEAVPVVMHTRVFRREEHPISRRDISESALKVLYQLIGAGHHAYLVGGGVRDLLLGSHPKDFDIATDATPEQVKELFRNCRLVGRRFRLAHVRFGHEVIEIATFRSNSGSELKTIDEAELPKRRYGHAKNEPAAARSKTGMLLRDNVYGTMDDDAARRDFTINALYYTPADFCLYDFFGGREDLAQRRLRLIGDPRQRYREDPVRILRALRLAAKLEFTIDSEAAAPLGEFAKLLLDIPPARLFDEIGKLFLQGHGVRSFELMRDYGVFRVLFPQVEDTLRRDPSSAILIRNTFANTDARVREQRPVSLGFLLTALFWAPMVEQQKRLELNGLPLREAMEEAAQTLLANQPGNVIIPYRFATFIRATWGLQPRMEAPVTRQVEPLLAQHHFRAAYDLLALREAAGEDIKHMVDWWTHYQAATPEERKALREALPPRRRNSRNNRAARNRRSSQRPPQHRRRHQGST